MHVGDVGGVWLVVDVCGLEYCDGCGYVLSPVHLMVVSGSFPGRLMMHVNAAPVAIAMASWRLIPTGFCAWEKPARSVFVLSPSWPAVFVPQQ